MADYTNILDRLFKLQKKLKIKGMSLAVFSSSKILLSAENGFADFYGERAVDNETKFMIGSITKMITAIAIMQLVEAGLVELDNDIKEYLPDFSIKNRFDDSKITIRYLLNHRSGLPSNDYGLMLSDPAIDFNEIMIYLHDQYLIAPPGKMYAYSNIGYTLLGVIIEKVTKKKYLEYVQKNIFAPLGVDGYFITDSNSFKQHKYEISRSYNSLGEEKEDLISSVYPAGANLYMSAIDVSKVCQMILNKGKHASKRILRESSVEEILEKPEFFDEVDCCHGLGVCFDYYKFNNVGKIVGQNGSTIYHYSSAWMIPEKQIGVVVLTNTSTGSKIIDEAVVSLLKESLALEEVAVPKNNKKNKPKYKTFRIEDYTGFYPTAKGMIKVTYKKQLRLKMGSKVAKMYLKENGWFDLKAAGIFKLFNKRFFSKMEVKIEKELLSLKLKRKYEQETSNVLGVFVKPFYIDDEWKMACGRYKSLASKKNSCYETATLSIKDEFLTLEFKGGVLKKGKNILASMDDNEAMILGYGYESSETILLNKNLLLYMGNVFIKESVIQSFLRKIGLSKPKINVDEEENTN